MRRSPREPACRRHDDAGLALDRLDQHGRGLRRDRALDGGEIAERHRAEARRERPEAVAVVGLGRERDDGGGAAVEVAVGDDDLGAVAGDAFDAVAPAAGRLDRGLHRLGAGVHRQRGVEPGELANFFQEGAEPIAVIGARRHREALGLRLERGQDAWMRMPVAGRRVGAHHVDVAPSRRVPQVSALPACEHDGQRRIVRCAVSGLQIDRFHGTHPRFGVSGIYAAAATSAAEVGSRRQRFRRWALVRRDRNGGPLTFAPQPSLCPSSASG